MTIYDAFFAVFALAYLPYLVIKGKAHRDFLQRFGKLPAIFKETDASRPVWIHAVSVGEVLAVKNFVKELSARFPAKRIVLSTTTRTGNAVAAKIFGGEIPKFYFPVDFSFVVKRVVNLVNPSAMLIMETEIWPNLILELSRRGIPVALINGRISNRSFKGYRKIRFFFGDILRRISVFCMQTERDASNIKALGAPENRVKITGNMKFDAEGVKKETEGIKGIGELLVAGSTHGGEEEMILEVYGKLVRKFRNLRLLIAPRHVDRSGAIKRLAARLGFEGVLMSDFRKEAQKNISEKTVLILDTLGELKGLFGRAAVVFMGGSLVKRGGHNIVEPAMFGKPIVFGPYMFNFRDMARLFLEEKAAVEVKDKKGLTEALEVLLGDKKKADTLGQNARKLLNEQRGATGRNVDETARFIGGHL
ncbi:MAG: 3-deoxy-D-manno-octulosonic acid transferase [Candidatus Omnitrophota bacterium]